MLRRAVATALLALLGLGLVSCGTRGSLGFKNPPTTTTSTTRGDDSLDEEPHHDTTDATLDDGGQQSGQDDSFDLGDGLGEGLAHGGGACAPVDVRNC